MTNTMSFQTATASGVRLAPIRARSFSDALMIAEDANLLMGIAAPIASVSYGLDTMRVWPPDAVVDF